jgi:two-component system, NtrC family, sensor kinase
MTMNANQIALKTRISLRERVKELSCLYAIANAAGRVDATADELFGEIVQLLPPAWQYAEAAAARISVDGCTYSTGGFRQTRWRQAAPIELRGQKCGQVEIVYLRKFPEAAVGPFLKEECKLIDAIAKQLSMIIERRQAEADRARLEAQMRHADRLATIGMLAAGVAHELNEPLGGVLGFAQLAMKTPNLPEATRQDLKKIESAALQTREVIKKLLVFARQAPPRKERIDFGELIEDSLSFFIGRCARSGIKVEVTLGANLPAVIADPTQMRQVLTNLFVNAIQAMPEGGLLRIGAATWKTGIAIHVEDTGIGMRKNVLEKIFLPFFTTKDVGQGTGLGLPVVHGIITAHGGSIAVSTRPGHGTRFEIRLHRGLPEEAENDH